MTEDGPSGDAPSDDGPAENDDPAAQWSTSFGDIEFADDEGDTDPTAEQRRRNGRSLTIAIAAGAVVVLAIAVLGVVLVRGYLDDTTSLTARMSLKYHRQYRTCVEGGEDRSSCATKAEAACASDPGWGTDPRRVDQIVSVCLFGPDATG